MHGSMNVKYICVRITCDCKSVLITTADQAKILQEHLHVHTMRVNEKNMIQYMGLHNTDTFSITYYFKIYRNTEKLFLCT